MASEEKFRNLADILSEFEEEPLKSFPSLKDKFLKGECFACMYSVQDPETYEVEHFILFDLEGYYDPDKWEEHAKRHRKTIKEHAENYYARNRVLS